MSVEDVIVGAGTTLHAGDTAILQFTTADWSTGRVLDRVQGGQAAVQTRIDLDEVVPGWWQGMPGMRVGGRRTITATPELALNGIGTPPVVLNSRTYFYVIDLLRVEPQAPPGIPEYSRSTMPLIYVIEPFPAAAPAPA